MDTHFERPSTSGDDRSDSATAHSTFDGRRDSTGDSDDSVGAGTNGSMGDGGKGALGLGQARTSILSASSDPHFMPGAGEVVTPSAMVDLHSSGGRPSQHMRGPSAPTAIPRSSRTHPRVGHGQGRGVDREPAGTGRSGIVNTRSKWRMLLQSIEAGPARHMTTNTVDGIGGGGGAGGGEGAGAGGSSDDVTGDGVGDAGGSNDPTSMPRDDSRGHVVVVANVVGHQSSSDTTSVATSAHEAKRHDGTDASTGEPDSSMDLATLSALDAAVDAVSSDQPTTLGVMDDDDMLADAIARGKGGDPDVVSVAVSAMASDILHTSSTHGPVDHADEEPLDSQQSQHQQLLTPGPSGRPGAMGGGRISADALLDHTIRREVWHEAALNCAAMYSADTYAKLHSVPTSEERAIRRDVGRTFAAFGRQAPSEDVLRALRYMLRALSQLDTELGYCQGLNFVAAMALKEVGEETGFWVCTHLMEEAQLRMLYLSQVPHLSLYIGAFEEYVNRHVPGVREHLVQQGFPGSLYAVEWFTTVYGINLPVEAALATVTMLILHVDNPLFRVGAAVLKLLKEPLLSMSLEGLMTDFKRLQLNLDPKAVIQTALAFPAQHDELQRLCSHRQPSRSSSLRSVGHSPSRAMLQPPVPPSPGVHGSLPHRTRARLSGRSSGGAAVSADRLMRAHVGSLWSRCARESMLANHTVKYASLLEQVSGNDDKIGLDVDRTSSSMRFGVSVSPSPAARAKDRNLAQALQRVLHCVAVHDTETGYCQGMNYVAQALVNETGEERAFWLMLRLLRQHHVRVLYVGNTPNLTHVMVAFGQYVQEHVPNVARHLRAMNFPPELYAVEWFTTLFACNLPELAVKCTISMMFGGWDNVLLRVGAAVLQCLEPELLSMDGQALLQHFKARVLCLNSFDVISSAVVFPPVSDVLASIVEDPARAAWRSAFSGVGTGLGLQLLRGDGSDAASASTGKYSAFASPDAGAGPPMVVDTRSTPASAGSDAELDSPPLVVPATPEAHPSHRVPRRSTTASAGSGGGGSGGGDGRPKRREALPRKRHAARARARLFPHDIPPYNLKQLVVHVKRPVQCEDCVGYVIKLKLGELEWARVRRYSEFFELHEQLLALDRWLVLPTIPPKQWFNSKEPPFILKRCEQLDKYLRMLVACDDLGGSRNHEFIREFVAPADVGDEARIIGDITLLGVQK